MLDLVVERYKDERAVDIYRRARDRGRMLPEGLRYISSWVDLDYSTCFQVMETADVGLFDRWIRSWADPIDFEIVPVRTSAEAAALIAPTL